MQVFYKKSYGSQADPILRTATTPESSDLSSVLTMNDPIQWQQKKSLLNFLPCRLDTSEFVQPAVAAVLCTPCMQAWYIWIHSTCCCSCLVHSCQWLNYSPLWGSTTPFLPLVAVQPITSYTLQLLGSCSLFSITTTPASYSSPSIATDTVVVHPPGSSPLWDVNPPGYTIHHSPAPHWHC